MVRAGEDHRHGLTLIRRTLVGTALAVCLAAGAACTGGGDPTPSSSAPTEPGASSSALLGVVCGDYSAARTATLALLDRMARGTETIDRFAEDGDQLDLTARRLYGDVAPLAERGGVAFRLITGLSTDMFHVIFGQFQEFRVIDPADVDPVAISELRADFDRVDRAIASGELPCGSS